MKPLLPALAGLALFLAASPAIPADDLVIGVENLPYLPYFATDRTGYRGYARELLDAFGEALGRRVQYRPLPVERLYHALLNGRIDCKFPDHPDWRPDLKAGHTLHYSTSVAPFVDGVMVRPERLGQPPGNFRRVGTVRGFTPWPLLSLIEQGRMEISENNSIPGLLRQTLAGRVDGAYLNQAVAQYQLRELAGEEAPLVFNPHLPHDRSGYRLSCVGDAAPVTRLDGWMADNASWIGELRRRWNIPD